MYNVASQPGEWPGAKCSHNTRWLREGCKVDGKMCMWAPLQKAPYIIGYININRDSVYTEQQLLTSPEVEQREETFKDTMVGDDVSIQNWKVTVSSSKMSHQQGSLLKRQALPSSDATNGTECSKEWGEGREHEKEGAIYQHCFILCVSLTHF